MPLSGESAEPPAEAVVNDLLTGIGESRPGVPHGTGSEDRRVMGQGMAFAVASFATSVLIATVSSITTSRIYGIKVIGEYAIVCAPWAMLTLLSTVSEQTGFVRLAARMTPRSRQLSGLFAILFAFSFALTVTAATIVMGVATLVMRGPLHRPGLVLPTLTVIVGYTFIDNTSWNFDAVLSTFRRGRDLYIARTVQYVTFLSFGVGLVAFTHTVWALSIATVAGFTTALCARLVLIRRTLQLRFRRRDIREARAHLREMLAFGIRVVPGLFAAGLLAPVKIWLLGAVSGVQVVGAYSRADGLSSKLSEAGWRVGEILYPTLVRHHDAEHHVDFTVSTDQTVRLAAAVLFLAVACAGGVARPVLAIFGPGFDRADTTMAVLFAAYAVSVVGQILGAPILAAGRPGRHSATTVAGVLVTMGLMYPFARAWSGTGIAIAALIGSLLILVSRDIFIRRTVLRHRRDYRTLRTAAGVAVAWAAGFGVSRAVVLEIPRFTGALVGIAAGAIAYITVAIFLVRLVRPEEWQAALNVVRRRRVTA